MKNQWMKNALSASVLIAIAGCASSHSPSFDNVNAESVKRTDQAERLIEDMRPNRAQIGEVIRGINYHDLNNYKLIQRDQRILPNSFEQRAYINDKRKDAPFTVDEFAALLYESYGIILDVSSPDLWILAGEDIGDIRSGDNQSGQLGLEQPNASSNVEVIPAVSTDSAGDYAALVNMFGAPETGSTNGRSKSRSELKLKKFSVDKGTVREMLDYVTIMNGLKWKYDPKSNKAYLYAYDTKEFRLVSFGSKKTSTDTITSGNSTKSDAGTTSGSSRSTSNVQSYDSTKDLENTIRSMMSKKGGSVSFDQKNGIVVVSDTDSALIKIGDYIDNLNKTSATTVTVQFRMLRVKYNEGNFKGMNHSFLNSKMESGALGKFSMSAGLGEFDAMATGSAASLKTLTGGNFLSIANDQFAGLIGFLNEIGSAEISYQTHVDILNNNTFENQTSRNREYIDEVTKQSYREGGGEDNITFKKGDATDGVSISLRPRIANDKIVLEYDISDSDIEGFDPAGLSSGLEGVTLKRDGLIKSANTGVFKNGETRILQVIVEDNKTTSAQGPIDHVLWFLGGKEEVNQEKVAIITTLTAYYNN